MSNTKKTLTSTLKLTLTSTWDVGSKIGLRHFSRRVDFSLVVKFRLVSSSRSRVFCGTDARTRIGHPSRIVMVDVEHKEDVDVDVQVDIEVDVGRRRIAAPTLLCFSPCL